MYVKPRIDISIDSRAYENIINNVQLKAPLEIGVEIAVYMLLFGLLDGTEFEIVDVNSMWLKFAKVYSNSKDKDRIFKAVPDLVIVGKDFIYDNDNNKNDNNKKEDNHAFGFVEVKSMATNDIKDTDEIRSHKSNTNHVIWTNGLKWYYYNMVSCEQNWDINLSLDKNNSDKIQIDERKYGELLYHLNEIDWRQ